MPNKSIRSDLLEAEDSSQNFGSQPAKCQCHDSNAKMWLLLFLLVPRLHTTTVSGQHFSDGGRCGRSERSLWHHYCWQWMPHFSLTDKYHRPFRLTSAVMWAAGRPTCHNCPQQIFTKCIMWN